MVIEPQLQIERGMNERFEQWQEQAAEVESLLLQTLRQIQKAQTRKFGDSQDAQDIPLNHPNTAQYASRRGYGPGGHPQSSMDVHGKQVTLELVEEEQESFQFNDTGQFEE